MKQISCLTDAEKAIQVSALCAAVNDNARLLGQSYEVSYGVVDRYTCHKKAALEIIEKIGDSTFRIAALGTLISLCMTARDIADAEGLLQKVTAGSVRNQLLAAYPELLNESRST